jgi:HD superfamily phosphodiesterase
MTTGKLAEYLAADDKFKSVYNYTKQRFDAATELTAHNWEHIYRDICNAILIGEPEGADMTIVLPAITMHDIGFLYGATGATHGAIGADKLVEFLRDGGIDSYSDTAVSRMASCIRTHKGSMHDEKPETLEAKVVADADLQEKFGSFGIYQLIRTYGEFDYPIAKILGRKDEVLTLRLETKTGARLADQGRQYVADFFAKLDQANQPYQEYDV